VAGLLFHDLRRTAVTDMVNVGIPEKQENAISGHKTRAMFDRYNIIQQRPLAEAAEKLDHYRRAQADKAKAEEGKGSV
jgi:hypothetical protein